MVALAVLAALVGGGLAWVNGSPWWGWVLVGVTVVLAGGAAGVLRPRRRVIQATAWLAALGVVAGTAIVAAPIPGTRTLDGPRTAPVATAEGDVIGVRDEVTGVEAFAGVPYAAPPVGDLRWEPPSPAPRRSAALVADDFGPSAFQPEPSFVTRAATRLLDVPLEQTLLGGYASDEDSLRLNVWRPAGASTADPRPVLVYLHGGSFASGSGALPLYDGAALASRGDIVVVTINYRLGVFGFLADDALGDTTTGNQGLLDQLAALRWLQRNIGAFGGDPARVTVAGESAGSGSACILGVSPLAAGLLHGIIGESGGCLGPAGDREAGDLYDDASTARQAARDLSAALDGATLDEMKAMPAERIAAAAKELSLHWWPTVDGHVLPDTPTALYGSGRQNDVPLLLGSNADETSLDLIAGLDTDPDTYEREIRDAYGPDADRFLALYPRGDTESVASSRIRSSTHQSMTAPMREWGLAATASGRSPAYTYYFSRTPPVPGLERFGAYHGAEIAYAYANLGVDGTPEPAGVDGRLEEEMSRYWIAFVTHLDPNASGQARWPSMRDEPQSVLEFGDVTSVVPRPDAEAVDFWLQRRPSTAGKTAGEEE
ncbi:carboxylesterase family protein [Herbiconiux sp. KACC 21604]|uniref:carboxylesterase/lipase family protein n=1 Tax=unclassified Herbiconiux TaxID=2618217 RepID=UPI0014920C94|nr:carboxylesterase family protein [Herbiconiux sp. SALV-R1]QJU55687.1 carboxylesterase family protein [Herbiconiux sp. SALV-R1]WPO86890.1 carboxylesterase family protein [Herbiconiux sp. KACC 21604]